LFFSMILWSPSPAQDQKSVSPDELSFFTKSKYAIIIDGRTGRSIYEKDADTAVRGHCVSACTFFVASPTVCFHPDATLFFHGTWEPDPTMVGTPESDKALRASDDYITNHVYPPKIRKWLKAKGGLRDANHWLVLRGRELASLVRICKNPGPLPGDKILTWVQPRDLPQVDLAVLKYAMAQLIEAEPEPKRKRAARTRVARPIPVGDGKGSIPPGFEP
jgi:hypothetical protein